MINYLKKLLFKTKQKPPYWSYQGWRMVATKNSIQAYKEDSLKTYNDFINGEFNLDEVLPKDLLIKIKKRA